MLRKINIGIVAIMICLTVTGCTNPIKKVADTVSSKISTSKIIENNPISKLKNKENKDVESKKDEDKNSIDVESYITYTFSYLEKGEREEALSILEEGIEKSDDEVLKNMYYSITGNEY